MKKNGITELYEREFAVNFSVDQWSLLDLTKVDVNLYYLINLCLFCFVDFFVLTETSCSGGIYNQVHIATTQHGDMTKQVRT